MVAASVDVVGNWVVDVVDVVAAAFDVVIATVEVVVGD